MILHCARRRGEKCAKENNLKKKMLPHWTPGSTMDEERESSSNNRMVQVHMLQVHRTLGRHLMPGFMSIYSKTIRLKRQALFERKKSPLPPNSSPTGKLLPFWRDFKKTQPQKRTVNSIQGPMGTNRGELFMRRENLLWVKSGGNVFPPGEKK